jgi:DNA-binding transcriptional ArsR family regulator
MEDILHYMRTEPPLLAPIFRSAAQARLLSLVLLEEDHISVTDAALRSGIAYPTAHREIARLLEAGIFTQRQIGRTRLISANQDSPLVEPLRQILAVTSGPAAMLRVRLEGVAGVESAFLYGSFASRLAGERGPAPNDIDVMVLGSPDVARVYDECAAVEQVVHRPVNPTIMTLEEWGGHSGFVESVRDGSTVLLVGRLPWD